MKKNVFSKCLLILVIVAIIVGVCVYRQHGKKVNERKLEARFDRFMCYYYPYIKDISNAANVYTRMKISLMHDYYENKKGRYIHETVNFYDGGSFSLKDEFMIFRFLEKSKWIDICKAFEPIKSAPSSRDDEKLSCMRILYSLSELLEVDIYEDECEEYDVIEKKQDLLDSLNIVIQSNFHSLKKYKTSKAKIDLNYISEDEYDLKNY